MVITERYRPVSLGVNEVYSMPQGQQSLGGFIAVTAGTITIVNGLGATVLSAFPVAAGVYYPLPVFAPASVITLAGGASGTILLG